MKGRISVSLASLALLGLAVSCWTACDRPPRPVTAPGADRALPPLAGEPSTAMPDRAVLLQRVREGTCGPEGRGYGRWLEKELVHAGGTLMFSDWGVRPGTGGVDEVRFTYSLLDAEYRVLVGAYVWEVGQDDGAVSAPRRIEPHEQKGPPGS